MYVPLSCKPGKAENSSYVFSQLTLVQNNLYAKVAYLGHSLNCSKTIWIGNWIRNRNEPATCTNWTSTHNGWILWMCGEPLTSGWSHAAGRDLDIYTIPLVTEEVTPLWNTSPAAMYQQPQFSVIPATRDPRCMNTDADSLGSQGSLAGHLRCISKMSIA